MLGVHRAERLEEFRCHLVLRNTETRITRHLQNDVRITVTGAERLIVFGMLDRRNVSIRGHHPGLKRFPGFLLGHIGFHLDQTHRYAQFERSGKTLPFLHIACEITICRRRRLRGVELRDGRIQPFEKVIINGLLTVVFGR